MPSCASATARFAASVDLPTPPLPLATAMIVRTPSIAAGPACGVGCRPIFKSGGGALGRGAVRGQERRHAGDARQRGNGGLGCDAYRFELRAAGRIDLEDEANAVVLDGQRAHDVGIDDAAAGAGHRHGGERCQDGFTGNGHVGSWAAVCL